MTTDTGHAHTSSPIAGQPISDSTIAPGHAMLVRYILSMAGMAFIDATSS